MLVVPIEHPIVHLTALQMDRDFVTERLLKHVEWSPRHTTVGAGNQYKRTDAGRLSVGSGPVRVRPGRPTGTNGPDQTPGRHPEAEPRHADRDADGECRTAGERRRLGQ